MKKDYETVCKDYPCILHPSFSILTPFFSLLSSRLQLLTHKLTLLAILIPLFICCKLPLGSESERATIAENKIYITGTVSNEDSEPLNDISVGLYPVGLQFPVGLNDFISLAGGLDVTKEGQFNLSFSAEYSNNGLLVFSGLGCHNQDSAYVQPIYLNLNAGSLKVGSPYSIFPPYADTTTIDISLARKVTLLLPDSDQIWESDSVINFHPTLNTPSTISWRYENMNTTPPSHTRFLFLLWSTADGTLWYYPGDIAQLNNQTPEEISIQFPADSYVQSLLTDGQSYRITIFAIENLDDPEHIMAVPTELFWDGRFVYAE